MNEKLLAQYNSMWEVARSIFEKGDCNLDSFIDDREDLRRGITLLAKPNDTLTREIGSFQKALGKIESSQYVQPLADLHLTILSIISCYDGFELAQIEPEEYMEIIEMCFDESIIIRFHGITASSSGVLIQGFPEGDGLEKLRNKLRHQFKKSSLQHSIDSRYRINTAHLTGLRFRKPMANHKEFVKLLDKFRQHKFGEMQINKLHLVFNDWYQRAETVKELATFELK